MYEFAVPMRNSNRDIFFSFSRWVREFLNDDNHGLESLIDYLSFRLVMMQREEKLTDSRNNSEEHLHATANGNY